MALTNEEKQIAAYGLKQGKTQFEVMDAVSRYRTSQPEERRFGDVGEDIVTGIKNTGQDLKQRFSNLQETVEAGASNQQNVLETGLQTAGQFGGAVGDVLGNAAITAGKLGLKESEEQAVGQFAGEQIQKTGLVEKIQGLSDRTKRNLGGAFGIGELLGLKGTKVATQSLFNRPAKSLDDLIEQTDTAVSSLPETRTAREIAEAGASKVSLREKVVGLTPDVKKRIEGKPEKLQQYFDAAHIRNVDDTAPTPYEVGANQAQTAVVKMEDRLSETGGKIGETRRKLGTVTANSDQVKRIEDSFVNELNKLNLELKNGVVRQKPGTILRVGSANDINVLNELGQELFVAKQNPSLTNLIDLRSAFDSKINFAKSSQQASSSVDPLSRSVRKTIADEAATIVGPTEAAQLKRYSEFMDAYNDLRSYTDRKAGGEYLLRLVLSGRGGEARQVIQTINEYTGVDLMDDATMMTLATDHIGNSAQKNLFRQEITKSGLDAARALSGDPSAIGRLLQVAGEKTVFDPETVLLNAASNPKAVTSALAAGGLVLYLNDDGTLLPGAAVAIGSMNPATRKMMAKELRRHNDSLVKVANNTTDKNSLNRLNKAINKNKADIQKLEAN